MPEYPEDLTKHYQYDPSKVERIAFRRVKGPLVIQDPDPTWLQYFENLKSLIEKALGPNALVISHVGSTSIPSVPAKPVIDIDLTVPDVLDEPSYVPALEGVGFIFLTREPHFHEHRLFAFDNPHCNLHVFAQGSAEPMRHLLFKNWIIQHEDDRELYVRAKREAAAATVEKGESIMAYNQRKEAAIRQILERIFTSMGLL